MADTGKKSKHLKAEMPQIPGLGERPGAEAPAELAGEAEPLRDRAVRILGPVAALIVLGALGTWFYLQAPRPKPGTEPPSGGPVAEAPSAPPPAPAQAADGPVVVATMEELAKPWSSKRFVFHKRLSNEPVEAMAVRLPGPGDKVSSYWAFSLVAPFGKCQLEYVTDVARLSGQYGYRATHPMVADPCNGALYDPLRMGTLPNGSWARGEIASGGGIRPPMAIEVRVRGNQLIATQIE
jgi:hypothetical protein